MQETDDIVERLSRFLLVMMRQEERALIAKGIEPTLAPVLVKMALKRAVVYSKERS